MLHLYMMMSNSAQKYSKTKTCFSAITTTEVFAASEINVDIDISKASVQKMYAEKDNVRIDIQRFADSKMIVNYTKEILAL